MRPRLFPIPLLVLALVGCAPGNPGLFISNVVAPNDQCLYATSNAALFQGILDVGIPNNSYEAVLVFNNQLISLSQTGMTGFPVMANPNIINVHSIEVEIRDIGGAVLALSGANPTTVPVGAIAVPTGDGMTAGSSLGSVTIIPAVYTEDLAGMALTNGSVVVSLRAIGETLGGAEVVSSEFNFPVHFCSGCLIPPVCVVDMDGENICNPSCTPGQDSVHLSCDLSCFAGGS